MVYYYACSYPLAPESVIQKGNWGRLCRTDAVFIERRGEKLVTNWSANLLTEAVFENIRLQEFPDRPSRFNCSFVCPNVLSARNFVQKAERYRDLLYEVELVHPEAKRFGTNWSLISMYPNITAIENAARKYWNPQNVEENVKEVLVESDIRIIKCLI